MHGPGTNDMQTVKTSNCLIYLDMIYILGKIMTLKNLSRVFGDPPYLDTVCQGVFTTGHFWGSFNDPFRALTDSRGTGWHKELP